MSFPKLETPASTNRLSGICLGLGAALALGLSSWAYGQDCGAGDISSTEACLGDEGIDTNGGCNEDIPVFEPANVGGSISGTVSTFLETGDCELDTDCSKGEACIDGMCLVDQRDTEWFLITQAEMMDLDLDGNGVIRLSSSAFSEAPIALFILSIGAVGLCDSASILGDIGFAGPDCAGGKPSGATIIIDEHPNGIVFWVGTAEPNGAPIRTGYECSTGNNDYVLTMEVTELDTACAPGSGPCDKPNGTPGCDDPDCCASVCVADPLCCLEGFGWDDACVTEALNQECICIDPGGDEGIPVPSSENFDSYKNGMALDGINGWGGWDDDPGAIGFVSNAQFLSSPHSVEVVGVQDVVQQYTGAYCEGQWVFKISQYIPSDMTGTAWFIMLNTYLDGGAKNWSTQVNFNPFTGLVDDAGGPGELPLITDEWVEIRVEIDLDTDSQTFFYGGTELYTDSWSENYGSGNRSIRALDLWGNGAGAHYYDDVTVDPVGDVPPCPADIDGSGDVGVKDLLFLLGAWGDCPAKGECPADFDDSGDVGVKDLLFLLGAWGDCPL